MPLPEFSSSHQVTAANAKQDKLEVVITLGSIRLSEYPGMVAGEAFEHFKDAIWRHLAGPPRGSNASERVQNGSSSRIFSRGGARGRRVLKVITKARQGIGNGALMPGRLMLSWHRGPDIQVVLEFRGYLNVCRYVRHQNPNRIRGGLPEHIEDAVELKESLFRRNPNADGKSQDEFSLDGQDNWIPDAGVWTSFSTAWSTRKREYLAAVHFSLHSEIQRVCECLNATGNPVSWHPSTTAEWGGGEVSLQRQETYWEFKHHSPLQFVNAMESELRAYCSSEVVTRHFRGREKRGEHLSFSTEKNCRLLDAEVAPGIHLVIYAKTNQRIRFEVRHYMPDLAHRRELLQRCEGVDGTCERIASVSDDAAGVVNRFFEFLRARVDFVPVINSPLDFLFQCAECAEKAIYGDSVVNMLLSEGRVARLPALTKTIRAMANANVLQRVDNEQGTASETFVVNPRYRQALEVLRRLNAETPIVGIIRRRRIRSPNQ